MKFRKLLSAGLGIMMFMSMFACSEKGNTNSTSDTASVGGSSSSSMQEPQTPQNIVTDPTMHYQNGLHKINVKKRDMPFITEGESDYKIVAKEKADESANMLRLKLESASGEYLDIVTEKDVSWSEDEKLIVIGSDSLFKAAGLTMPPEDLGETGYYLVSKGKSVSSWDIPSKL